MNKIKQGWFSENNELWPGQCFSLEVEKELFHEKSEFQDVMVLQTTHHGKALVLDGIIQCTEHDEFAYQEMISFLPLCAHPNPKKVLIVGGGDGGVAREVHKHPQVQKYYQVEIDRKVIDICKVHLPDMARGFDSPRLTLIVGDGFEFMKNHQEEFDVIITDSSDPIGPAANLFTETYFELLKEALKPGGVICSQGEALWANLKHIRQTMDHCRKHFPVVKFACASVPTYPTGQIGFVIGCLDKNNDPAVPKLEFTEDELEKMNLKYYSTEMHSASFVLPNFAKKALYN